jgi:ribokinase
MASGVALITVETAGENRIAYVPGPTLRITGAQVREVIERCRPAVYLQPNEIPVDAARVALSSAKEREAITILNAAPDPVTARPLLVDVDVLIVNEGEAFALLGREGAFHEAARALAEEYGASVALTAGADGAYAWHEGQALHAPAPKLDVVDSTGAGDTFCGALATRLAQGDGFEGAVRWAVVAASLATTVAGAQPSIPTRAAVGAFLARQMAG